MAQLREKQIHNRLKELEDFLLEQYKKEHPQEKRDYGEYEKEFKTRFRRAMKNLNPLIEKATKSLRFYRGKGDKPTLRVDQKLRLLLLSQLAEKSNLECALVSGH
jgi:hypothetical protein